MTEITVNGQEELARAACRLLSTLPEGARVLAFHGPMGLGKTTFIAALCRRLGVTDDEVNSPTFAIINIYEAEGEDIYHFDLYRLEGEEQAMDIGAEDYLYSGNWCFVEWPEKAPGILPPDTVHVSIREEADGSRVISIP